MAKYSSILKLEVRHEYYANGLCTDLIFSPSPKTQNLIEGHRLIVKYRPAGLEVFAPLDRNDNLLIPVEEGLLFQWFLQPKSADFYSTTALPPKDSNGQYSISNFENGNGTAFALSEYGGLINEADQSKAGGPCSLAKPFTDTHELEADKTGQSVELSHKPVLDATKSDFVFEKAFENDSIDLRSLAVKSIQGKTLELSMNPLPRKTIVKITYPVAAKGGKKAFALMNIKLGNTFNKKTDKGIFYSLNLEAKKENWQYFILTERSNVLNVNSSWQLKMPNGTSPQGIKVRELDQNTAPESTHAMAGLIWDRLKSRVDTNNERAYFFYCNDPLPIREDPLTDLVIQHEKGSDVWEDVFINLPAPTPQNQGVQIINHPTST